MSKKSFTAKTYEVIEDYPSSAPQNLELRKGDSITHVKPLNNGWAYGRNARTKETGFFPMSFTKQGRFASTKQGKPELPNSSHRTTMILSGEQSDSDENESHKEGRNALRELEMNEDILQKNTRTLIGELTSRLQNGIPLLSPRTASLIRRIVLAVCGVLLGALFCGALFSICVFSFKYSYRTSGIITGVVFLLVLIGVAGSRFLSCCLLLVVPSLFTSQGRGLLLAAIFILLMSGPGANVATNTVEVSRCLACVADMIHNQLMQLAKQITEPLHRIARALQDVFQTVVNALEPVVNTINSIINAIDSFFSKVEEIASKISGVFAVSIMKFLTITHLYHFSKKGQA